MQTFSDPVQIGCNANSNISDIINAIPYPASELSFWINSQHPNIFDDLQTRIGTVNSYGTYTIRRIGTVWSFEFESYNMVDTYIGRYTTINNVGWANNGKYRKITMD